MKTETRLIGWFRYRNKEGKDMVCFIVTAQPVPADKGDGFYTKNFYVAADAGLHQDLKMGKVEIITNAWNSNILEGIKNI